MKMERMKPEVRSEGKREREKKENEEKMLNGRGR